MLKRNKQILVTNRAQSIIEYTIIIGIVTTIFFTMGTFIKRTSQGMIKTVADQIGTQKNADQKFIIEDGYLANVFTDTDSIVEKATLEDTGFVTYQFNDRTHTESRTETSLGFAENPD